MPFAEGQPELRACSGWDGASCFRSSSQAHAGLRAPRGPHCSRLGWVISLRPEEEWPTPSGNTSVIYGKHPRVHITLRCAVESLRKRGHPRTFRCWWEPWNLPDCGPEGRRISWGCQTYLFCCGLLVSVRTSGFSCPRGQRRNVTLQSSNKVTFITPPQKKNLFN